MMNREEPAQTGLLEVIMGIKGGHGFEHPEMPLKERVSQSEKVPASVNWT
jgi:hypothetical protein